MMESMPFLIALLLAANIAPDGGKPEYRQPQLAADSKMVAVTFGAGAAIYFAASHDQGRTLSAPVKVAEAPILSLGRHRGPRIAITPSAIVISAVVGTKMPAGSDGNLKAWRSTDGGKTWSGGVTVNDEPAAAREGLHAMAAGAGGRLFAAWLDLRKKGTRLYGATSTDGGATWSKNVLVYESSSGTICQCCHPSVAIDAKGEIHVMWRNALDGNRDMYVASSADGGATFGSAEKVGAGSWKLDACPMDGGGLAVNRHGKLVSVWRRASDVFLAEPGSPEQRIETGKDAALAIGSSGVYAIWIGNGAVRARIPGKPEPVLLAPQGAFPQLVAVPDGPVIAAWEDHGQIAWKTL
jgi:hypothetical protein